MATFIANFRVAMADQGLNELERDHRRRHTPFVPVPVVGTGPAAPHRFECCGPTLTCLRCRKWAVTIPGRRNLRRSNCKPPSSTPRVTCIPATSSAQPLNPSEARGRLLMQCSMFVFCTKCGAYQSDKKSRKFNAECRKPNSSARDRMNRLLKGKHPMTREPLDSPVEPFVGVL